MEKEISYMIHSMACMGQTGQLPKKSTFPSLQYQNAGGVWEGARKHKNYFGKL